MKLSQLFFLPVFALMSFWAEAQVKGTVTSQEDGMPLTGVSVFVSGAETQGAASDFDGNYVLNEVDPNATLIFSYVGYKSQEVQINGRSIVDVVMQVDAASLEEIIVTGYSRERKVDVTGAITVVDLAPIEGASMSSGSAVQGLQGRVPGVFIEKSGDPTGSGSRVLIRGATTLGNNDPLYVIDGVPTVRQEVFSSINPSTIESVQVLKDASASSLYGARAGNGVIIVTTKNRARALGGEKFQISVNSNISVLSEKKQRYDMLNAVQRGEALWQASVNDGADPNGGYGEIYNFDWNEDFNNPV